MNPPRRGSEGQVQGSGDPEPPTPQPPTTVQNPIIAPPAHAPAPAYDDPPPSYFQVQQEHNKLQGHGQGYPTGGPSSMPGYGLTPTSTVGIATFGQGPASTVTLVVPPQHGGRRTKRTVVTTVQPVNFGSRATRMNCPYCGQDIYTKVEYTEGTTTHCAAFLLFLFQCYVCCLLPYCIDECKDAEHSCPNCNHHLGIYRR